ncbi:MAG: hypothetical protein Q7S27_00545 [Nanoarchaeota archaeon]|nr:hypothetical protein [Nanoarchaeota archaeon]
MGKPKWEVDTRKETVTVDGNLEFRLFPLKGHFLDLREADYGLGFEMPVMSQLISLYHSAFMNLENKYAKEVMKCINGESIAANTGVLNYHGGMFIQDKPPIKSRFFGDTGNGKGWRSLTEEEARNLNKIDHYTEKSSDFCAGNCMEERDLFLDESILGDKIKNNSSKVVEAIFSEDKTVRFVPFESYYKINVSYPEDFKKDSKVIALVGGLENAEKLVETSSCVIELYPNKILSFASHFWSGCDGKGMMRNRAYSSLGANRLSDPSLNATGHLFYETESISYGVKCPNAIQGTKKLPSYTSAEKPEIYIDLLTLNTFERESDLTKIMKGLEKF